MASTLTARFTKRYASGAVIQGALNGPASGHGITVLFGPSGCGKTTVLRCLAGLETPEEGLIQFGTETWFDARHKIRRTPQQRGIGLVFQDYALFPHLTVADNLGYGLARLPVAERRLLVGEMVERFGLGGLTERLPRALSGGQQQRVALARALACRPRLLLLDEPLAALDAALREEVRTELRQWLAACEIPVFLVTHDRQEALALGDALVVMNSGEVRQSGPVQEVFQRPADLAVARSVGMEIIQPGQIVGTENGLATVAVGAARLLATAPKNAMREVYFCLRAEEVLLGSESTPTGAGFNQLPARVISVQPGSPFQRIELDAGFPLVAFAARPVSQALGLRVGNVVTARIEASAIHLIPRSG
jgi:molybdate transport system ATP-binding protein